MLDMGAFGVGHGSFRCWTWELDRIIPVIANVSYLCPNGPNVPVEDRTIRRFGARPDGALAFAPDSDSGAARAKQPGSPPAMWFPPLSVQLSGAWPRRAPVSDSTSEHLGTIVALTLRVYTRVFQLHLAYRSAVASSAGGRIPSARARCTASSLPRAPNLAKMLRTR